jgi:hypothetical protein
LPRRLSVFFVYSHYFQENAMRPFRFFAVSLLGLVLFTAGIAQAAGSVSGAVADSMNSGGYTYVLLKNDAGETWVAMPEQKVEKGQQMTLHIDMEMKNFHSATLNRDFASIVFSSGAQAPAQAAKPDTAAASFAAAVSKEQAANQNPHGNAQALPQESAGSAGAVMPFADIKVEKATGEGAVTVGEAFANAKKLNGQTVRLRGRVMKVSHAIMGRNWIHLQDGTGDPLHNTHDLVATSDAAPTVGEVVVVSGKLAADKDFGAGYRYAALIEEAKIEK